MATRIGYYTGKLYDSTVDSSTIKECCLILNFKEPVREDEELVIKKRAELKERCNGCFGCEESRKRFEINNTSIYREFENMISYGSYRYGQDIRKYYSGKQIKDIIKKCLDDGTVDGSRRLELITFKEKYMDSKYPISDNNMYSLSWYGNDMVELRCYKKQ